MGNEIKVHWDKEDECFVAVTEGTDLIGCGDTEEEAIRHLRNHLLDEKQTPRKKNSLMHIPIGKA